MITRLFHGINIHQDAEGSIIQSVEVEEGSEESTLKGMRNGRTEIVRTWTHSFKNSFTVRGHGDLTLAPSTGAASIARISTLAEGKTSIVRFRYAQTVDAPSDWEYSGNQYPYAA